MNLIPEQLKYAGKVDPKIASWSNYLQAVIEQEDLIAWAKRDEPVVIMSLPENKLKSRLYKFLP